MPHLQVPQVAGRESPRDDARLGRRRQRRAAPREKLRIARRDIDHPGALRVKEVADDEGGVGVGEVGGRLQAEIEEAIARPVLGERLELNEERRHQIERDPDIRELADHRRHPVIVLEAVQPHPRQDVLVRDQIFVERLVHVPEDRDLRHRVYSVKGPTGGWWAGGWWLVVSG